MYKNLIVLKVGILGALIGLNLGCTSSDTLGKFISKTAKSQASSSGNGKATAEPTPTPAGTTSPTPFAVGKPLCGLIDDVKVHLPANYETFARPAKGQTYTDAAFGCSVTRLSDGA